MPSSDRIEKMRDRSLGTQAPASGGPQGSAAPKAYAAVEPPQYFDPSQPWDAQSAEALTRLYESGEADLAGHGLREQQRRWLPPQGALSSHAPPAAPPPVDQAWLEERLADVAQRLQESLAGLGTDKVLDPVNARLDLIEQRLEEALGQVAQRSDLDGLRLIEANVMELAAYVEQTRGRLERLDTIDDQVRAIARRMDETDHQQLAGLEKLLQDYMTEWRRGDERTASTIHNLEETVNRIGDAVDAMEVHKPAPDLSLSILGPASGFGDAPEERDPLAQVYAGAEHQADDGSRASLNAADYAPRQPAPEPELAPPAIFHPLPARLQADALATEALPDDHLPSPGFRASAMRAKLRQAQLQSMEEAVSAPASSPAASPEREVSPPPRRARAGFLLAAAVTLCAAGGYLAVDVIMSNSARHDAPASIEHAPRAPGKAAVGPQIEAPDTGLRAGDLKDRAPSSLQEDLQRTLPPDDHAGQANPPVASKFARMEAIGNAIAAVFRVKTPTEPPAAQPAATPKTTPAATELAALAAISTLPMTIGPASMRQAAMRGDAAAQFEVATRFATGLGVTRDLQQALQWYARAAGQGMALAQYRLAAFYERGWGAAADPEKARVWYGRAAEQGNVKAMHNLAVLSVAGGRNDYAKAAKWFARAADFGLTDSQFNLAVLHQNGFGVPKDMKLAYTWLSLAARFGDREAAARVAEAKSKLDPAEVEAADATVASWRARTPDPAVNEQGAAALTVTQ